MSRFAQYLSSQFFKYLLFSVCAVTIDCGKLFQTANVLVTKRLFSLPQAIMNQLSFYGVHYGITHLFTYKYLL